MQYIYIHLFIYIYHMFVYIYIYIYIIMHIQDTYYIFVCVDELSVSETSVFVWPKLVVVS